MNLARIILQLCYSLVMALYFLSILFGQGDLKAIPWLLWPFCGVAGSLLIYMGNQVGDRLLLWSSLATLAIGTLFHVLRIGFIIKNGGMEPPDGMGSPMAFILGWAFTTVLIFIPGVLFVAWNLNHRRLTAARNVTA
jgi:hypothetical protein